MKTLVRIVFAIGALACALALAPAAGATAPMPLPDFELTALDGRTVHSSELASNGQWLLIYVQPNCRPCDALLKLASEPEFAALASKVAIVVGGSPAAEVGAVAARFPNLAGAAWYADAPKAAAVQMKATGAPVAFGVLQTTVVWHLNGVLPDSVRMKSILQSWIAR